ncbi:MAG TPA: ABC transporter ATP-binding protein, partial [Lacipirellulaceae bacterium]|nr:ABC transporter ATP-binding protein [Lacipirellulaceae bacterium]
GRTVMELLKQVAVEPGRAVIVVTHDARVLEYGDRTIEMADGRVVAPVDTAFASPTSPSQDCSP